MEWLEVLGVIALFAFIGGAIGEILMKLIFATKPIGTLRIDTSDSDGPYLFLELNKDINEFYEEDQVVLMVNTENFISQK